MELRVIEIMTGMEKEMVGCVYRSNARELTICTGVDRFKAMELSMCTGCTGEKQWS